ncbi:response regulator transcription factor [Blastococcus sp. LR1]|uniref:response regulator transcription factor n=1 Tax=Blastococcus sp. LR1 TaxID=2877000 RepID=UPI001CC92ED1|nr:response regulator transcription factor [Blastococcus sp. LR1]MCA0145373.1 response regulator transcription factor [Blastococcus sp. LR1]
MERAAAVDAGTLLDVPRSVLVVEDDARIRRMVQLTLRREGFDVAEASSGEEALLHLAGRAFDVVLLDLRLPGLDGFQVCREIRRTSTTPVIMVTARSDSDDVVAGLEAGADDYVTKPFVPKELLARVRAITRRARDGDEHPVLTVGDLEISPLAASVTRAGSPLDLTKTEFRLLVELAADRGRALSREELLQRVWGYDYFGDSRLVDVHIRRLRKKVELDPANPVVVTTVRGMGYRVPA